MCVFASRIVIIGNIYGAFPSRTLNTLSGTTGRLIKTILNNANLMSTDRVITIVVPEIRERDFNIQHYLIAAHFRSSCSCPVSCMVLWGGFVPPYLSNTLHVPLIWTVLLQKLGSFGGSIPCQPQEPGAIWSSHPGREVVPLRSPADSS